MATALRNLIPHFKNAQITDCLLRNVPDTIIAMNENEQPGKYGTMKRKGGVRTAPDAWRMYQEALMVRKVKAYLANVNIITDEEVLHRTSVEVEPPLTKISMVSASMSSQRSGGKPAFLSPSRSSSISQVSEGKTSLASGIWTSFIVKTNSNFPSFS